MKNQFKSLVGLGKPQHGFYQFLNAHRPVNMQRSFPAEQLKGRNKPRKPETMVAVEMRNKNMIDFRKLGFGFSQLYLRSLAAVYQKMPFCHFQKLCRRRGSHGRYGRIKT